MILANLENIHDPSLNSEHKFYLIIYFLNPKWYHLLFDLVCDDI